MIWSLVESALRQGLLLVPLALGVHVAFRFARYPDLTADGSLLVGSAICVTAMLSGMPSTLALVTGALGGGLLGSITAVVSEKLCVDRVLAGLATSLAAYTVALRVLGRGNVAIPASVITVFDASRSDIAVSALAAIVTISIVFAIARSQAGLRIRAVGENRELVGQLGGAVSLRTTAALIWANVCVALSGSLLAQHQRFVDVGQGAGTLFIGLACVLIGGALPGGSHIIGGLVGSACGALLYSLLIAFALSLGLNPGDLKAITAGLVILAAWTGQHVFPTEGRPALFP